MSENSTLSQLLRYAYDEGTAAQLAATEKRILKEPRVYSTAAEVVFLRNMVQQAEAEPRQKTLDAIMAYAKAQNVVQPG